MKPIATAIGQHIGNMQTHVSCQLHQILGKHNLRSTKSVVAMFCGSGTVHQLLLTL